MDDFPISFRFIEGIAVVTVEGPVDFDMTSLVDAAIWKLIERERYRIVLDAPGLSDISDSGLGVLMAHIEELRERGGDIKFVAHDQRINKAFDQLGFPMLFDYYPSVYEAVEAFLNEDT